MQRQIQQSKRRRCAKLGNLFRHKKNPRRVEKRNIVNNWNFALNVQDKKREAATRNYNIQKEIERFKIYQ